MKNKKIGRTAKNPFQIPLAGFRDIFIRIKSKMINDNMSLIAAGLAFYIITAFIPFLLAVIICYGFFNDPIEINIHLSVLKDYLPGELYLFLENQIFQLIENLSKLTEIEAIIATLLAVYNASKGTKALIRALNTIYKEKEEGRKFIVKIIKPLVCIIFLSIFLAIIMILLSALQVIIKFFEFDYSNSKILFIASTIVLFFIISGLLGAIYKYFPNRKRAKWQWVSLGSFTATILWGIGSFAFTWYVTNLANYNASYGVLGTFIVGMIWTYMTSYIVLLGAQINAEVEHQTRIDSTVGEDKPMGERGAEVADTIGESFR